VKSDSAPIGVGVVGTGYFGSGLLRRLALLSDFEPRIAANRTLERAMAAFERAGIPRERVVQTNTLAEAQRAIDNGYRVATTEVLLACELDGVDVVCEATGDLLTGAIVADAVIRAGKHLVAANSDTHATVGPILKRRADAAGVVYTDIEGDEPGLVKNLVDYCESLGLDVVAVANGKGILNRAATPATQARFAAEHRLQPWLATAAADGTKLNFEMTVVANALGLVPRVRGMLGLSPTLDDLAAEFERAGLLDGGRYVDYVLGARGVFAVVRSDDPEVQADFRYVKMGEGPFYVFHHPRVLIHYEAPRSIARAARLHEPTVAPAGGPVADTIAYAKRDLDAGQTLDGIGGFDLYGLIVRADEVRREELLPIGIAQYARLRHSVRAGEALSYRDVAFESENMALALRREQDAVFTG
jgi:predicted homoserine dehydrogenase-like protein